MTEGTPMERTSNRQAIGYVRVSTIGQAVEGVSLDAQRHAIEQHAKAAGLDLIGVEADEGVSGKSASIRPGLQRAIDTACRRRAVLVVYSLSRFARNTRETLELSERLERAGADLASITERIDTSGACGRMIFRMLSVLAEFERDLIAERTRVALAEKKRQGAPLGSARPGHWDGREDRRRDGAAKGSAKAAEIRRASARSLYDAARPVALEMRGSGASYRTIAHALNDRGMSTATGAAWHAATVSRLIGGR